MSSDRQVRSALSGQALRAAIKEAVGKVLNPEQYEVFIFGSEATEARNPRSDIDVGILGEGPVPGAMLQQIRQELETLRTLRCFDVVDFTRVDESFKAEALRNVERL